MKKLLYIFTFALLVIACDKYEDGFESIEPTAVELAEVDATIALDHDVNSSVDRLLNKVSALNKRSTKQVSASKAAIAGSTIKFYLYSDTENNVEYEIFIGDDIDTCAPSSDFLLIELVFVSTSLTEVYVDGTLVNSLEKDLTTAFELENLFLGDKIDFATKTISPASGSGTSITFGSNS